MGTLNISPDQMIKSCPKCRWAHLKYIIEFSADGDQDVSWKIQCRSIQCEYTVESQISAEDLNKKWVEDPLRKDSWKGKLKYRLTCYNLNTFSLDAINKIIDEL